MGFALYEVDVSSGPNNCTLAICSYSGRGLVNDLGVRLGRNLNLRHVPPILEGLQHLLPFVGFEPADFLA